MAGPASGTLVSPLPAEVELLGLEIRDKTAYVDLSEELRELSGVELTLADYCLTLTLTALDSVRAVILTAQGRAVGQQPKQVFYERDVLLADMDDVLQTVEVSLYFLDAGDALAEEKRTLSLYEGRPWRRRWWPLCWRGRRTGSCGGRSPRASRSTMSGWTTGCAT